MAIRSTSHITLSFLNFLAGVESLWRSQVTYSVPVSFCMVPKTLDQAGIDKCHWLRWDSAIPCPRVSPPVVCTVPIKVCSCSVENPALTREMDGYQEAEASVVSRWILTWYTGYTLQQQNMAAFLELTSDEASIYLFAWLSWKLLNAKHLHVL